MVIFFIVSLQMLTHLRGGGSYSPFAVYAMTQHNGDYSQAAKSLLSENRPAPEKKTPPNKSSDFIVISMEDFHKLDPVTKRKLNDIAKPYDSQNQGKASKYGAIPDKVATYILDCHGSFSVKDLYADLCLRSDSEKTSARRALKRQLGKKIIERTGSKNGVYRRIETDLDEMDLINTPSDKADIWLPLGVNNMVDIYPGNIILISGERNVGKTTLSMNIAINNLDNFNKVHYFNSETGATQFRNKILKMSDKKNNPVKIEEIVQNGFKVYARSMDFQDAIQPGRENLNIIDWIELSDEFYKMAGILADIHKKLDGAIAIVNVQKNTGKDLGQGGEGNFNKPTLALNLYRQFESRNGQTTNCGKMKIMKAKEWDGDESPEFKCIKFRLENGCDVKYHGEWGYDRDKFGNIIAGIQN